MSSVQKQIAEICKRLRLPNDGRYIADVKGKVYATKACTDYLRVRHSISTRILSTDCVEGIYIVQVEAVEQETGRTHTDIGACEIDNRHGKGSPMRAANAIMTASTRATRRATLALLGAGVLDESEMAGVVVDSGEIPSRPAEVAEVQWATEAQCKYILDHMDIIESHNPEFADQLRDAIADGQLVSSKAEGVIKRLKELLTKS